ncbi:uncharacterized protein LOC131051648 isoform X2 [Cryptomeria japonica]|uniref:uncharacterized protein LOC131051648 isoform X2 n=1 Tax=Cryptomeria japonica TaxID=3369 RepID=UPI0025AC7C54|nr:uncharacterized protein LOC131051648 isoform X2 [Cryptomeria japonica]
MIWPPRSNPPRNQPRSVDLTNMTVKLLRTVDWSTTKPTGIIKKINGLLTVPFLHFEWSRNLVKKLPFGAATVELSIAVGRIIVALKLGSKEVFKNFASVIASLMFNRYGEEAALITADYMEASGHVLHILWNAIQILDPISLPLDVIPEFHDIYVETGIDHIKDVIEEEVDIDWFKPIPEINKTAAWEAVAIYAKKETTTAKNSLEEK